MVNIKESQTQSCSIAYLDTFALWQTDPWLLLANDEHIAFTGGERVVDSIFDVNDIEAPVVALTMSDNTNTAHIATTSYHCDDTSVKANEVANLAGSKIDLDCVVDLDSGIWVTDPRPPSVYCNISNQTLVQRLIDTGATYVRASCVTKNGIPPRPSCTLLTLPNLYSASAVSMRWTVKRPLVS
jgi:hypothetical protein